MDFSLGNKIFYYQIAVYPVYRALPPVEYFIWEDVNAMRFFRWRWYFKYRAALLQVKYPRATILIGDGNRPPLNEDEKTNSIYNKLVNRLRNKKGRVTQWENKIKEFEANWNQLFPITDDEGYNSAKSKFYRLKIELKELEQEVLEIENKVNT